MPNRPSDKVGLRGRAAKFYNECKEKYDYNEGEQVLLLDLSRQIALVDRLELELTDAPTMIPGSRPGTFVLNPIITELRMARQAIVVLTKALALPQPGVDDEPEVGPDGRKRYTREQSARKAAQARWGRNGAA